MNTFSKLVATAALAVAAAVATPVFAVNMVMSPAGEWQMTSGEARYKIELCGDGTQVCATLTWLRDDVATAENLRYLNKQVVTGATLASPAKWRGQVTYQGETYDGALTLLSSHTLKLTGCKAIACESMMLQKI